MKTPIPRTPLLRRFCRNEAGAVTADWVVLTAGIVLAVLACLSLAQSALLAGIGSIFGWVATAGL